MARSSGAVVPKTMAAHYQSLVQLTDAFCARHLDANYADLARRAAAALCRKRQSPVLSGHMSTWACGIIYALGQVNFLSDKTSAPFMTMQEVCAGFGVAASTGGNKAKTVRDAIGIRMWDHRWMLTANIADNSVIWLVQINGLPADIRHLPRPIQVDAFERGLIPYVPADGPDGDGGTRDAILRSYDRCRAIASQLQTDLAKHLWNDAVAPVAQRLGLIEATTEADERDFNDLAEAIDLALYTHAADGTTAVQRHVNAMRDTLPNPERQVLDAMCETTFSFFRIEASHRGAGVDFTDMISGERLWVMDRGIDATAFAGAELAMRVFKPDDFWVTTGVAAQMDKALWDDLERSSPIRRKSLQKLALDRDAVAEMLYRLASV